MELGPGVAKAFLAGAEGTEVLGCSGDDVIVEVEVDTAGLVYRRLSVSNQIRIFQETAINASINLWRGKTPPILPQQKDNCHTFNVLGRIVLRIKDGALPSNVEVGLDGHDC